MFVAAVATAPLARAQETEFRPVTNPYQEGFAYRIGDDLVPGVEIDGLRWTLVRIATKGDTDPEPDREMPIIVDVEFENRREHAVSLLVVLLLEGDGSRPLERLEFPSIRAGAGRFKASRAKFKLGGDLLIATRSVYLFCEIEE